LLLQGFLDLPLVCLDIDDEYQGVVLLNLLHRALRIERVDEDLRGIEARPMGDRLARVLWRAGEFKSLWAVERRRLRSVSTTKH